MYTYKIFNNIALQGINCLKDNGFIENENDPDALIIRSASGSFSFSLNPLSFRQLIPCRAMLLNILYVYISIRLIKTIVEKQKHYIQN